MDAGIALALALFQESPVFWCGVLLWLCGFATYVPAVFGRGHRVLGNTGMAMCGVGFAITLFASLALDARYTAPPFEPPALEWAYWWRASTQVWLLWLIGGALVIASALRWFTPRVGWLGVAAAMTGIIAAWFADRASQDAVIEIGAGIVAVLFAVLAWRDDLLPRVSRAA